MPILLINKVFAAHSTLSLRVALFCRKSPFIIGECDMSVTRDTFINFGLQSLYESEYDTEDHMSNCNFVKFGERVQKQATHVVLMPMLYSITNRGVTTFCLHASSCAGPAFSGSPDFSCRMVGHPGTGIDSLGAATFSPSGGKMTSAEVPHITVMASGRS